MKKTALAIIIFLNLHCTFSSKIVPVERTKILMDTFIQIIIYDQDKKTDDVQRIIDLAFQRIEAIDRMANNYNDSSFISLINRQAAFRPIIIDSGFKKIIMTGIHISEQSDGMFDITIGSLKRLWHFSTDSCQIADADSIQKNLEFVDYHLIDLKDDSLRFKKPGVVLDLGAIAKGFAVDEAIHVLLANDIKDALVNAGGNLRALSSKLTIGKRKVWIKHPRIENELYGYFQLDEGSVATSGDYERYCIKDSIRYHHILNPRTGYPANDCVSVTILTDKAMMADALSTAVFVLGRELGMKLVESLPGVEAIILFEQNGKLQQLVSNGLKNKFKLNIMS